MKLSMNRTTCLAFAAGAATAGVALLIGMGPGHEHEDAASPEAMSPAEEMAAMMAAMTPGEHHKALGKAVGEWSAVTSFTMDPSAPPVTGTGGMSTEWVLGGRFVKGTFHMDDMMGMPFDGISYIGYDNVRQEYVSVWMDSFSTGIMAMKGEVNKAGEQRMHGKFASPTGEEHMELVTTWQDDDHFTDTFYDIGPDGSKTQSGQIKYTRR